MQSHGSLRKKRSLDHEGDSGSDNNSKNNNLKVKLAKLAATATSKTSKTTVTVLSLPLNIWLRILKHLPLRHVLTLACVSQEFFVHIFNMAEFWLYVQRNAKCNNHVPTSDAPLAFRGLECRQLVMNYMNSICDYCYSGVLYSVDYDGHKAVLPVRISQDKKDANTIRRRRYSVYLCGTCRILHFQHHPEPIYEDTRAVMLSREEITARYCLPRKDITYLWGKEGGNIFRQSDAYTRLFARCVYGGDVGIEAEKQRAKHMVGNL